MRLFLAFVRFALISMQTTVSGWWRTRGLPAELRGHDMRARVGLMFSRYLAHLQRIGLIELDLTAIESLRGQRSLIIAPNHPSLIDAPLIISRLPDVACIMKASVGTSAWFGKGATMCEYIRNDCAVSMVRESIDVVRGGRQLLIFPEGTRSVADPIGPLTGAFVLIARRAGAPIQTVVIEHSSRFLGKGWPLWRLPEFPLRYRMRLGPRFEPDEIAQRKHALVDDVARFMQDALSDAPDHPVVPPRARY